MPPALLLQVPLVVCGVLGAAIVVGRVRAGRRTASQWLALAGFIAWSVGAGIDAVWPLLVQAGVPIDLRHLVVNWLRVACVLTVALVITTFGIRERLRPAFVVGAIAAGLLVWWLPGHGAILGRQPQTDWLLWAGMGLYLGYLAAAWSVVLDVGRARYRVGLPLQKQVQLRLVQAMSVAALTHVGATGLAFVGVQAEWPGFSVEATTPVLSVLLVIFALLFWLALAPPDTWLRLAARMEATEARAFAATFAVQTKEDAARGRDLGWRIALIALAEQVARARGCGFDEVAHLRLAAALLHTDFEVRASSEPTQSMQHGRTRSDDSAVRQGVHSLIARTVWVPPEVLAVLREAASDAPKIRAARMLKVVDRYVAMANPWDPGVASSADTASAFAAVDREFPDWEEVEALRSALTGNGAL